MYTYMFDILLRRGDIMKNEKVLLITILLLIFSSNISLGAERVSLGFMYGEGDIELVTRTNGAINQVSPSYLDISSRGNLVISSELTHKFVNSMHEQNIVVTPFLSNHWVRSKGRAAIKNAENLSNQICEVIEEYDLDGINVDIENLTVHEKEAFTEFVRILSEKMPKDKVLSVSVAANPDGSNKGWQGSYDYKALGMYADYLFVMAYDEHSQGGECGPVSSLEFVENSIKYALQFVSKDKIVLGIPLYGRYWKNGASYGGEAVVIGAIPNLISRNKGIVKYDSKIGEAKVTFSINNAKIKSKINGKTLEDGTYTIWYPNEESIKEKLNLINEYDLLGAGVWALGQEKVDVWEYYNNELNRLPYVTEKEEERRREYEALMVDLSNLELPEIFKLKEIENKGEKVIEKTERILIIFEEEEHIHTKKQSLDKASYTELEDLSENAKKKFIRYKKLDYKNGQKNFYSRKILKGA